MTLPSYAKIIILNEKEQLVKHMFLSFIFLAMAAWVMFPGARMLAAEKHFVLGVFVKAVSGFLLLIAMFLFAFGYTSG